MTSDLQELFDRAGHRAPPTRIDPDVLLHRARRASSRRRAIAAVAAVALVAVAVGGIVRSLPHLAVQPPARHAPRVTLNANGPIMGTVGQCVVAFDSRTGVANPVHLPLLMQEPIAIAGVQPFGSIDTVIPYPSCAGFGQFAWSADGRFVAGVVDTGPDGGGESDLRIWKVGSSHWLSIPIASYACNGCSLSWVPSGQAVLLMLPAMQGGILREYDATTGRPGRVWNLPATGALSPDDTRLATRVVVSSNRQTSLIELIDLNTGKTTRLAATAAPGWDVGPMAWSPDGHTLAYLALHEMAATPAGSGTPVFRVRLMTVNLATQRTAVIRDTGGTCYWEGPGQTGAVTWSPDGTLLAVSMPVGQSPGKYVMAVVRPDGSGWRTPWPNSQTVGVSTEPVAAQIQEWLDWRAAN